jgi:hypothetical protein
VEPDFAPLVGSPNFGDFYVLSSSAERSEGIMRQIQSNISVRGIQSICQGISLIVRRDAMRPVCAVLSALRGASRMSDNMRDARWHGLELLLASFTAKQPAPCFATAKQHGRYVRVTGHRSVA